MPKEKQKSVSVKFPADTIDWIEEERARARPILPASEVVRREFEKGRSGTALEAPVDMAKIEADVSFVLLGRDPEKAIREASEEDAATTQEAASDPVRRAVEAEREACALAALDEIKGKHPQDYHREIGTASRIAKRIRARAEVRRG